MKILKFTLILILIAPFNAYGQFVDFNTFQREINIRNVTLTSLDRVVFPNAIATVRAERNLSGLNRSSEVRWFVDGERVETGEERHILRFETGDLGVEHNISISLHDQAGNLTGRGEITLIPISLILLTEVVGNAPPLHKGRIRLATGGDVKLQILVNAINPATQRLVRENEIYYRWILQGVTLEEGLGENFLYYQGELANRRRNINVDIDILGQTYDITALIDPQDVERILIYESDPLLGTNFNNTVRNAISIEEDEKSVFIVPYAFSNYTDISSIWSVDGEVRDELQDSFLVTFTKGDESAGSLSNIGVSIRNNRVSLQRSSGSIQVIY